MIRQIELLFSGGIHGGNISGCEKNMEAVLKRLFRRYKKPAKPLEILSVHGSMSFNIRLIASIPESTCLNRLQHGLHDFRSKPCFDMIFYSLTQDLDNSVGNFLEDLCYCRMLLRPGAFLFLMPEGETPRPEAGWYTGNRNRRVLWLRQAGFKNITTQKMGNRFVLVGGQRPLQKF